MTCPECRKIHTADNTVRSFPQNKYILANIRRKESEDTKDDAEKGKNCKKHGKELGLYCSERSCRIAICPLCMLQDHRSHDVVDVQQVKHNEDAMEKLKEFLLLSKAKLVSVEEEMEQNYENYIEEIRSQREELIRKLEERCEKMLQNVKDQMTKVKDDIRGDISAVDEKLEEIDEINENTKAKNKGAEGITRIESEIRKSISGVRIYKYYKYEKSLRQPTLLTKGDLDELCGKLAEEKKEVYLTMNNTVDNVPADSVSDVSLPEPPEGNLATLAHEVLGAEYVTRSCTQEPLRIRAEGKIVFPILIGKFIVFNYI